MELLGQQEIHHFSHEHPLKLAEIKHDDEILCSACRNLCSGQTYVCSSNKCKFFLDHSCFNLPRDIRLPFHPYHVLKLDIKTSNSQSQHLLLQCNVCHCSCSCFTYSCYHCSFSIHVECSVVISSITYEGHCHNILFFDSHRHSYRSCVTNMDYLCSACDNPHESLNPWFRCAEYNFNLHLECGPLPCFIKDKENHPCPLKLTDSPVMVDGGDKGGDWFICDVCEEDRDPRLPVYYCTSGCSYIAAIKCVILQVRLLLSGEYGEVELRSAVLKHKGGKVICKGIAKGIEPSMEGHVSMYYKHSEEEEFIAAMEMEDTASLSDTEKYYINGTDNEVFSGSDEDYTKFIALIDTMDHTNILEHFLGRDRGYLGYTKMLAGLWGNNGEEYSTTARVLQLGRLVKVWKYTSVSSELAPIFEDLCAKYEDIIPQSTPSNMSFYISSLCETVRGMCLTRVVDISTLRLFSWLRCLKALRSRGFKVEFALDRLKVVADAFYALQSEKKVKEDSDQIDRKIQEVSRRIKELEAELIELKELKERRKRREQQNAREPQEAVSSSGVAECFKKGVELKWKIAGEGLL